MKHKMTNSMTILIVLFLNTSSGFSNTPINIRKLDVITLSGSGYELGLQHGQQLKSEIVEIVKLWKNNLSKNLNKDVDSVLTDFYRYAHFSEAIIKYTPELYEEVRGIADGSGQAFNDILGLNLMDEYWVYLNNIQNNVESHHCSIIGVPAANGNPCYLAQNMDIEKYNDGFQFLMRLKRTATSPEQLIVTFPGGLALTGMNEEGIGLCVNTLLQLKASATGLPVIFIIRKILSSTNKEEILRFIQSVPHASGQNYMIGIKGEIFDFEASANKLIQYFPTLPNGILAHTNHPLINSDVKTWYAEFNPELKIAHKECNSCIRLASVEKNMSVQTKPDDSTIKLALRATDDPNNAVCRSLSNNGRSFTFGSIIMTLTGKPSMQVTAGPPNESGYQTFGFPKK